MNPQNISESIDSATIRNYIKPEIYKQTLEQIKELRKECKPHKINIIDIEVSKSNCENYVIYLRYVKNQWETEYNEENMVIWAETKKRHNHNSYTVFHYIIQEFKTYKK